MSTLPLELAVVLRGGLDHHQPGNAKKRPTVPVDRDGRALLVLSRNAGETTPKPTDRGKAARPPREGRSGRALTKAA